MARAGKAAEWKARKIKPARFLVGSGGIRPEVEAEVYGNTLAVHQTLSRVDAWAVTHMGTKWAIKTGISSLAAAKALAEELAALDWNFNAPSRMSPATEKAARAILVAFDLRRAFDLQEARCT